MDEDPAPAVGNGSENISMSFLSGDGTGSQQPSHGVPEHMSSQVSGPADQSNQGMSHYLQVKHPGHSELMNEFQFDRGFTAQFVHNQALHSDLLQNAYNQPSHTNRDYLPGGQPVCHQKVGDLLKSQSEAEIRICGKSQAQI